MGNLSSKPQQEFQRRRCCLGRRRGQCLYRQLNRSAHRCGFRGGGRARDCVCLAVVVRRHSRNDAATEQRRSRSGPRGADADVAARRAGRAAAGRVLPARLRALPAHAQVRALSQPRRRVGAQGPQALLPLAGLRVRQVHAHCGTAARDGGAGGAAQAAGTGGERGARARPPLHAAAAAPDHPQPPGAAGGCRVSSRRSRRDLP